MNYTTTVLVILPLYVLYTKVPTNKRTLGKFLSPNERLNIPELSCSIKGAEKMINGKHVFFFIHSLFDIKYQKIVSYPNIYSSYRRHDMTNFYWSMVCSIEPPRREYNFYVGLIWKIFCYSIFSLRRRESLFTFFLLRYYTRIVVIIMNYTRNAISSFFDVI